MEIQKTKVNTCNVCLNHGRLRIRLPRSISNGKQHFLYTGLVDSLVNQKRAQQIALMIEADIDTQRLDTSLERYKRAINDMKGKQTIVIARKHPQLNELWDRYALFKESQVSKAYFYNHFVKLIPDLITKLPTRDISKAIQIRDYLVENYTYLVDTKREQCNRILQPIV